ALDKFTIDAFLHDDPAGRGAALASRAEPPPEAAFNGEVEIGVVEHNHRILATQFERAVLETLGGDAADDAAHRGRSRQRNRTNVGMLGERSPHIRAKSAYDVDDALGQARVGQ